MHTFILRIYICGIQLQEQRYHISGIAVPVYWNGGAILAGIFIIVKFPPLHFCSLFSPLFSLYHFRSCHFHTSGRKQNKNNKKSQTEARERLFTLLPFEHKNSYLHMFFYTFRYPKIRTQSKCLDSSFYRNFCFH